MLRRRVKLFSLLILASLIIALPSCSFKQPSPLSITPELTTNEAPGSVSAETPGSNVAETPKSTATEPAKTTTVQGVPLYKGAKEMPTPDDLKVTLNISELSYRTYKVNAKLEDVVGWYKNQTGSYILSRETIFSPPDNPAVRISMMYYRNNENGVFVAVILDPHVAGGVVLAVAEGPWSKVETSGIREAPKEGADQEKPGQTLLPPPESGGMMYQIYPLTDDAPVLELYWGPPDLDMNNIARFTPYGIWEGPYEPAYEMQFYTFSSHDPVYAPCAGTIVYIWSGIDQYTGNQHYALKIRYGRNYGVTLHHLVDVPSNLKAGDTIEPRTLVGYTQGQMGVGWWEIEVVARVGNVVRTQPPYDFFAPESKKKLDAILIAARKKESSPYSSWTVITTDVPSDPYKGQGSWIQDMGGKKEWWASGDTLGLKNDPDTLEDFLKANKMEWLIPHCRG